MILAGTVITRVGDNPRHKVVIPSLRAIFRSPSKVEVNARLCVSSTAHSAPLTTAVPFPNPLYLVPATQYSAWLFMKNTSRQHAVTPRFGGRVVNACGEELAN